MCPSRLPGLGLEVLPIPLSAANLPLLPISPFWGSGSHLAQMWMLYSPCAEKEVHA